MAYANGARVPWMNPQPVVFASHAKIKDRVERHVAKHHVGAATAQLYQRHLDEFRRLGHLQQQGHCRAMVALWAKASLLDRNKIKTQIQVRDSQPIQLKYFERSLGRIVVGKDNAVEVAGEKMYNELGLSHKLLGHGSGLEDLEGDVLMWANGFYCLMIKLAKQSHAIGLRSDLSAPVEQYIYDPAHGLYQYSSYEQLRKDLIDTITTDYREALGQEYCCYELDLKLPSS